MDNNAYSIPTVSDIDTERYLIGELLSYSNLVADAMDALTDESFYDPKCREAWRFIVEATNVGESIDLLSISARLMKTNGASITQTDLIEMMGLCISSVNFHSHLQRLHELELRRKLKTIGLQIQALSINELTPIDECLSRSRELIDKATESNKNSVSTLTDALQSVEKSLDDRMQGKHKIGSPTGFKALDAKGGFRGGNLIIVAADTSVGKSSFAMAVARSNVMNGSKVAFYSLEMTKEELTTRLLAMDSGVSLSTLNYGTPSQYDMEKVNASRNRLRGKGLYFDDRSTSNIDNIIASIRRMKIKHGISGAAVDYLQILNVNTKTKQTREQLMGDVARRLKNLAKELGIWILALSQLNRDRDNPEPSLSRLRDSGQIAEAADMVILLYRPELSGRKFPKPFHDKETHNTALIDVAKGRNTGIMKFLCGFIPETTLFYDTDVSEAQESEEPF